MRSSAAGIAVALQLLCLHRAAFAEQRQTIESRAKLIDPVVLAPLLARGEVALIEAKRDRQVLLLSIFPVSPETVYDAVMDVESYPKFLRTIAEAKIEHREKSMFSYRWKLDFPLISLGGTRLQRGQRPSLIEVRGDTGNFRGSAERWELYPLDGGKRTLVAFYRTLDVETGGIVVQTLAKLEPAFAPALAVSTSFVHLRDLSRYVAGQPPLSPKAPVGPVPPFRKIDLGAGEADLAKLSKLLELGLLALVESNEDGALRQVSMFTVVEASKDKLQAIVQNPAKYPEFIPNFAEQKARPIAENKLALEWELEVPFVNLHGTSEMTIEADGSVDVVNTGGDIPRGRYRFEFVPLGEGRTIPVHYAYSDVRQASFFTRKVLEKQPLFEHGAVMASVTIALKAVKERAEGKR